MVTTTTEIGNQKSTRVNLNYQSEQKQSGNREQSGGKRMLDNLGRTEQEFLETYDASQFDRPSVTVDMLIFTVTNEEETNYRKLPEKELKILLIKRNEHPFIGQWALPGGFVRIAESLDEAAIRELKSETNVDNIYLEQLYTWGEVRRDPRTRVINTSYMSLVDCSALNIHAGEDAAEAKWFSLKVKDSEEKITHAETGLTHERIIEITLINGTDTIGFMIQISKEVQGRTSKVTRKIVENHGLAFDHGEIIQYGLERLRKKIEYTDISFNLMPELFTLTELQQVYETILDKPLLKANFRRKTADMVSETNQLRGDAGHRPSKLFRFNSEWKKKSF